MVVQREAAMLAEGARFDSTAPILEKVLEALFA